MAASSLKPTRGSSGRPNPLDINAQRVMDVHAGGHRNMDVMGTAVRADKAQSSVGSPPWKLRREPMDVVFAGQDGHLMPTDRETGQAPSLRHPHSIEVHGSSVPGCSVLAARFGDAAKSLAGQQIGFDLGRAHRGTRPE